MAHKYAHTQGSHYADPGYQKDGKLRYPTETPGKTESAWGYIKHPDNAAKYSPANLAKVKAAILRAYDRHKLPRPTTKSKSSIVTAEVSAVKPKMTAPDSTLTHFFTIGRLISYNEPNLNGVIFFREDCEPVLSTLQTSLADVAHVKPGNGLPNINGHANASIGAIYEVHEDEEGIDIICKNDRDVTNGLGFSEDDFRPLEGSYSAFSQESDFSPESSPVIAVKPGILHNINSMKDIVYELHPDEAKSRGLSTSYYDPKAGKWVYNKDENGNTLFVRLRPISFSGVGHVITPADEKANIYSYAASIDGEEVISEIYRENSDTYPSLDDPGYLPPGPDVSGGDTAVFDQGGVPDDDFRKHPDLSCASGDYFSSESSERGADDHPDDHFAALYYDNQESKTDDPSQPKPETDLSAFTKQRMFRVKNKDGKFDRARLIGAYQALKGMRGNTQLVNKLPPAVAQHALAVIRQGLDETKPKERQSMSTLTTPAIDQDIEALKQRAEVLSREKDTATASYQSLEKEFSEFKSEQAEVLNGYKAQIDELTAAIKEKNDKELSSTRLAALNDIHPFSDEEKGAETWEEFSKSLATISEDRFDNLLLRRELKRSESQVKSLSSLSPYGGPRVSPAPQFDADGEAHTSSSKVKSLL